MRQGPPHEGPQPRTIRVAGAPGSVPAGPDPDRTGRRRELTQIRGLVPDLTEGRGGLVLLTGPTGIGKTFLAHTFLQELPPSVLTVTASPLGYLQTPGLWPVQQIARAMLRRGPDEARQEFDRLTRGPGRDELPQFELVERMVDLLAGLSCAGPVAALLDDLHRADPLTVAVVEALGERVGSCPLLLLVCARVGETADPVDQALQHLRGRPRVLSLHLAGLAQHAVERLIGTVRCDIEAGDRREIARVSAGNPLLSQELAHLWAAQRRIAEIGGPAPALPASATLRELVAERLASVDADEILAPLAVLGRPATLSLLADASGVGVPAVRRVLERASSVGLVRLEGNLGDVRMAHAVFGDVLLERLDPERTRGIHLRLASLFDRSPVIPGPHHVERARHLIAAGDDAEATASACLVAALYEEGAGGLPAALELVAYGLDNCASDLRTRVHLLRLRGRCLARAGRQGEARHQLLRAVQTARLAGDTGLYSGAVVDLTAVDDGGTDRETVIHLLRDCLASTGGTRPAPLRALLASRLSVLVHLSDPQQARELAQEAVTCADNDPRALREAHHARALVLAGISHLQQVERSRNLLTARGHLPRADALAVFLTPDLVRGDRTAVDHYLARVGEDTGPHQGRRCRGLVSAARLGLAVADADAEAVPVLLDEVIHSPIADVRMLGVVLRTFWRLHAGPPLAPGGRRPGTGRSSPEAATAPSAELADLLAVTRATTLALRADPQATVWLRSRLARGCPLPTAGPGEVQDLTWAVTALAGHVLGDKACCRAALAHFAGHADKFVAVSTALVGPVGWFTALAHEVLGETSQSLGANAKALELSRRFTTPTWTAQCLLQRSRLLAADRVPEATELATEAVSLARERQLTAIVAQADRDLASLRPPAHPLDRRQLELLRLAGAGLRNDQIAGRLFVSTATVERHLSQIYRKLGVANRAAATRWLSLHTPPSSWQGPVTDPVPRVRNASSST